MVRLADYSQSSDEDLPHLDSILPKATGRHKGGDPYLPASESTPKNKTLLPKSAHALSTRKVRRLGGGLPDMKADNPLFKPWSAHDGTGSQARFQATMKDSPMKLGLLTEFEDELPSRSTRQPHPGRLTSGSLGVHSSTGDTLYSDEDLPLPTAPIRQRQRLRLKSVCLPGFKDSHKVTVARNEGKESTCPIEIWSDEDFPSFDGLSSTEVVVTGASDHLNRSMEPILNTPSYGDTSKHLVDDISLASPKGLSAASIVNGQEPEQHLQEMNANLRGRVSGDRSSMQLKSSVVHDGSNSGIGSGQNGDSTANSDDTGISTPFQRTKLGVIEATGDSVSDDDDEVEFFTPPSSPPKQVDSPRAYTRLFQRTNPLSEETLLTDDESKEPRPVKRLTAKKTKSMTGPSRQTPAKKESGKKVFESRKQALALEFFQELDDKITGGQIAKLAQPTGGVKLLWTRSLNTTAGRANWRRETIRTKKPDGVLLDVTQIHHASIELADKVIDDNEKLLNVMAHEFCHLANFMISGITKNPHGKEFKSWAAKCSSLFSDRGVQVTTKHSYAIDYKYIWACDACGTEYKRHSKSIDPHRHRCGSCKAVLKQTKPLPRGSGTASGSISKPNEYQTFVKEQMKVVRKDHPESPQKDLMGIIARKWANAKRGSAPSHDSDTECAAELMDQLALDSRD